jgi:hypothetical protein
MLNFVIISRHTRSTLVSVIHKATNSTQINIETEMKNLNGRKEFVKAIALFDKHKHKHQEMPTDRAVVQALKACTRLGDVKRGVNIHKELANHSLKDVYIQSALIHFYSKLIGSSLGN